MSATAIAYGVQLVPDEELTTRVVREAHATWCELLIEIARSARELNANGHVTQANALRQDLMYLRRRAQLHMRNLRKEGAANDGE